MARQKGKRKKVMLTGVATVFLCFALSAVIFAQTVPPPSGRPVTGYSLDPSTIVTPATGTATEPTVHFDTVADSLTRYFASAASSWQANMAQVAIALFWCLATIDFVMTFGMMAVAGTDFQEVMVALMKRIIYIAFSIWLLTNLNFLNEIINGFRQLAGVATGSGGTPGVGIAGVWKLGIKKGVQLVDSAFPSSLGPWDAVARLPVGLMVIICAMLFIIVIALISAYMALIILEFHFMFGIGVIMLGFLGSHVTRDWATRFLSYAVGIGIKMFVATMLINAIYEYLDAVSAALVVSSASFVAPATLVASALVAALLFFMLPGLAQSFATGAVGQGAFGAIRAGTLAAIGAASMAGSAAMAPARAATGTAMAVGQAAGLATKQMASLGTKAAGMAAGAAGGGPVAGMAANLAGKVIGKGVGASAAGMGVKAGLTAKNLIQAGGRQAFNKFAGIPPETGGPKGVTMRMAADMRSKGKVMDAQTRAFPGGGAFSGMGGSGEGSGDDTA